ncbi:hypothetical protein INR49_008102 [Caranx melampygus]|nr:hypothetical protein INR49_008102 [Caranx melampygus]
MSLQLFVTRPEVKLGSGDVPDGKKPCSWNSCMTRARRWSRVLRRDEYGTRSRSPNRSSPSVPGRRKHRVKMSPSHLAALFGVLGSELQLDRRRVFLLGELGSSTVTSSSERRKKRGIKREREEEEEGGRPSPQDGSGRGGQTLQGGRGKDLLRIKLWKLGEPLLEVRLRQNPAPMETQRLLEIRSAN